MRIGNKFIKQTVALIDDATHIAKPEALRVHVPISRAPKPAGMGISVEKTATKVVQEVKPVTPNMHATQIKSMQTRPFLTQTAKNPYNIIQNPLEEIHLSTEEEFLAYMDKQYSHFGKEVTPCFLEQDKQKLLELFRTRNPHYVEYLTKLRDDGPTIYSGLERRFNTEHIEKLLDYLEKDEKFVLNLINEVNKTGQPLYYGYKIEIIMEAISKEPNIAKDLFLNKKLSPELLNKVMKIYKEKPQRFQEMAKSGIFDLIANGRLSENIFENVGRNTFFTSNFLGDVKKVHQGKPLVTELPQSTNLEHIGQFIENGEVGIVNGKLYANQAGKAVELKISKEKFEELFPLIDRFKISQGNIGDCWLISGIDNFMSNPTQRIELYKLMSQEGNDILIKYPAGKNPLRFVNGEVYNDGGVLSEGTKGHKMFEQSFAFHRANKYTKNASSTDVIARLTEKPELMEKLDGGFSAYFSDAVYGHDKLTLENWCRFFSTEFKSLKNSILHPQRFEPHTRLSNWNKTKDYIVNYSCEFNPKMINGREGIVNWEYDLFSPHAYALQDYNVAERIATLSNPHHTEVLTEAPLDVLTQYGKFNHLDLT